MNPNKKVEAYQICKVISIINNSDQHEDITFMLSEGWQPWGAPFSRPNAGNGLYQVLVKYKEEK